MAGFPRRPMEFQHEPAVRGPKTVTDGAGIFLRTIVRRDNVAITDGMRLERYHVDAVPGRSFRDKPHPEILSLPMHNIMSDYYNDAICRCQNLQSGGRSDRLPAARPRSRPTFSLATCVRSFFG